MVNKVKFVKDDKQKSNELKHYGVLGMKWGVRKEDDRSSIKGPVSNKYYKIANSSLFKKGVKALKLSSLTGSSTKSNGSSYVSKVGSGYVPNFSGKAYKIVKASKKASGSKGSSAKAKAEKALKEKVEKVKKTSGGKSSGSGKSGSSAKSTEKKTKDKGGVEEINEFNGYMSVDPDFNEKFFTAENKLGNTDFYAYKNDNGVWVISDKEKKWVLPEGLEIDKADMTKKLEEFENAVKEIVNSTGYEYAEEELDTWRTAAINKIISELRTPQQETNEKVAEVINNLLVGEQKEEKDDTDKDRSNDTKIGDNVSKVLEEEEEKKKR